MLYNTESGDSSNGCNNSIDSKSGSSNLNCIAMSGRAVNICRASGSALSVLRAAEEHGNLQQDAFRDGALAALLPLLPHVRRCSRGSAASGGERRDRFCSRVQGQGEYTGRFSPTHTRTHSVKPATH